MASPEEHLKFCEKYRKRAVTDFHTAESLEDLEDKACYFASSAEFLLLALDHLLMWFARSDKYSRSSRLKALENSNKFIRLETAKKSMIRSYLSKVEIIRNKTLYLQTYRYF